MQCRGESAVVPVPSCSQVVLTRMSPICAASVSVLRIDPAIRRDGLVDGIGSSASTGGAGSNVTVTVVRRRRERAVKDGQHVNWSARTRSGGAGRVTVTMRLLACWHCRCPAPRPCSPARGGGGAHVRRRHHGPGGVPRRCPGAPGTPLCRRARPRDTARESGPGRSISPATGIRLAARADCRPWGLSCARHDPRASGEQSSRARASAQPRKHRDSVLTITRHRLIGAQAQQGASGAPAAERINSRVLDASRRARSAPPA